MKQEVDKAIHSLRKVVLHLESLLDNIAPMTDADESIDTVRELWGSLSAVYGALEEITVR